MENNIDLFKKWNICIC